MITAIPTMYKGIQMRSRLEAKWAAFFDALRWNWTYEPFDLAGYIPDFVLNFEKKPVLVEVKGADAEIDEAVRKFRASKSPFSWVIVGHTVTDRKLGLWHCKCQAGTVCDPCDAEQIARHRLWTAKLALSTSLVDGPRPDTSPNKSDDELRIEIEGDSCTEWGNCSGEAQVFWCDTCFRWDLLFLEGDWGCKHCGVCPKHGLRFSRNPRLANVPSFAAAGNAVQWKAPR